MFPVVIRDWLERVTDSVPHVMTVTTIDLSRMVMIYHKLMNMVLILHMRKMVMVLVQSQIMMGMGPIQSQIMMSMGLVQNHLMMVIVLGQSHIMMGMALMTLVMGQTVATDLNMVVGSVLGHVT